MPQLYVVLEAERRPGAASRHGLADVDEVVIGRGEVLRIERTLGGGVRRLSLSLPDNWLSRRHARLVRRGDTCTLRDLESTNGTQVNGLAIASHELADGDLLQVGHTFLLYRAAVPTTDLDPVDFEGTESLVPALIGKLAELRTIAASTVSVSIGGETGTGKELLARAVHAQSGRTGEFVAVNCGAIPRTLVESALFGHKKGAFSGANADRTGLVAASSGGTLFLDEIGDLPLESQAALLRVLQEREVTPVGATRPEPVDLRVLSASHADIDARAAAGTFRTDLAARLSGFSIRLPALRDRREDLGLLIAAILRDLGAAETRLDEHVARALLEYDWPRNIRELRSCLETALALARGGAIQLEHLGPVATATRARVEMAAADTSSDEVDDPDAPRRAQLEALLREHAGNVSAIARSIGKARTQVQRWLRRHGIDASRYRGSQG
jgi:DNA-binding NtrC family response regulator